jgi:hypothetical protein
LQAGGRGPFELINAAEELANCCFEIPCHGGELLSQRGAIALLDDEPLFDVPAALLKQHLFLVHRASGLEQTLLQGLHIAKAGLKVEDLPIALRESLAEEIDLPIALNHLPMLMQQQISRVAIRKRDRPVTVHDLLIDLLQLSGMVVH